jgi:anti-anti-sigma factor
MNITESHRGNILVLSIEGRLDHAGAGQFQELALKKIADGAQSLIVDFGGTSFLASMGFRALMLPSQELGQKGGRLALVGLNADIARLFELSGLEKLFEIHANVEEAAASGVWP